MTCNLYDEHALRGVTYGHNSCMTKQEFVFLIKLCNKNLLSDDHYIPRKSSFQDTSTKVCSDAKQIFMEHTS